MHQKREAILIITGYKQQNTIWKISQMQMHQTTIIEDQSATAEKGTCSSMEEEYNVHGPFLPLTWCILQMPRGTCHRAVVNSREVVSECTCCILSWGKWKIISAKAPKIDAKKKNKERKTRRNAPTCRA